MVRASDSRLPAVPLSGNNLGQVVHTHMSSSLHSGQSLASLVVGADWYILVVMVTSHQAIILGTGQQTCQGPEMKMRETVRHSGEGAIFFGGGSTACDAAFG